MRDLKREGGGNLVVLGSAARMFGDDPEARRFELVSAVPGRAGLLLATYRAAPAA